MNVEPIGARVCRPILGFKMRAKLRSDLSRLFAGDLAAFGGPTVDETVAAQIRAEQLTLVMRHTPGMMLANACNAAVLAIALWHSPDGANAALWASALILLSI